VKVPEDEISGDFTSIMPDMDKRGEFHYKEAAERGNRKKVRR
jgi:hypothetical protein